MKNDFKKDELLVMARPPEDQSVLKGLVVRVVRPPLERGDLVVVVAVDGSWRDQRGYFVERFERVDPDIAALYGVDQQ